MPIQEINGMRYYLVLFDDEGRERTDVDFPSMRTVVCDRLSDAKQPITDIFITCHGWMGDIPAASQQFDKWIGAVSGLSDDIARARSQRPDFEPLVVGLHWPSLPWGMEEQGTAAPGLLSGDATVESRTQIDALVKQLAGSDPSASENTTRATAAIESILHHADSARDTTLPFAIDRAYSVLSDVSGMRSGSINGRPGADQAHFDPSAMIADASEFQEADEQGDQLLGIRDVLLSPLRQFSFWKMKERARIFGETGAHAFLMTMQDAAPMARCHLMGHSFGCIVVSAMVGGADGTAGPALKRPVSSLFLVQGALSLWAYASDIPYVPGTPGYFRRIVDQDLVSGPIVTTRSSFDRAVGRYYPLGARLRGQRVLGEEYPEYGGIGSFGIRGSDKTVDMTIQNASWSYAFQPGTIYNVDASGVIKHGKGAAGAHSDIVHPEVAHLFWEMLWAAPDGSADTEQAVGSQPASGLLSPAPSPAPSELDAASGSEPLSSRRGDDVDLDKVMDGGGDGYADGDYRPSEEALLRRRDLLIEQQARSNQSAHAGRPTLYPNKWVDDFLGWTADGPGLLGDAPAAPTTGIPPTPAAATGAKGRPARVVEAADEGADTVANTVANEGASDASDDAATEPLDALADLSAGIATERYINANLDDIGATEPLIKGKWYTVAFSVDEQAQGLLNAAAPLPTNEPLFAAGVDEIMLTVQLDSADFDLSGHTGALRLPREGRSHTKARFDISPLHDGPCSLTAIVSKDGNFVQKIDITIDVGVVRTAQASVTSQGRVLSASSAIKPRDLMLLISPATGGYDCVVCGAVAMRAHLPITVDRIDAAIREARAALMQVVMQRDDKGFVFQRAAPIEKDQRDIALPVLAQAGATLLQTIFEGPGSGLDSRAVAALLRKLAANRQTRLKLQIVAESMPVPWGMLYIGSAADDAPLDWDNFIGMRHMVEQIPLQNPMVTYDSIISSDKPSLNVGVSFNDGIDTTMRANFVQRQRDFWKRQSSANVTVRERSTWPSLFDALNDREGTDHILYFYCHAVAKDLTDPIGPSASTIILTDAARSLAQINRNSPSETQLLGNPLVFVNACESAEMSSTFYDGFAPYFMSKGARGVIGTECKTPALFAADWAEAFFTRFLDGDSLGKVFLDLRTEFLTKFNNPLGLLYAVHCDGDTVIDPRIPIKGR